jgi:hypothetical protein
VNIETTTPTTARAAELMASLAESRRELENPRLFLITRKCIAERIGRLESELARLTPTEQEQTLMH